MSGIAVFHWLLENLANHDRAILAIAALASPFVALFAALRVSKAHIRTAIAGHRQDWINELRHEIATAVTATLQATSEKNVNLSQEQRLTTIADKNLRVAKIKLLLNPTEQDHKALAELFDESAIALTKYLRRETTTHNDLANINRRIVELTQSILKREWDRVQANE